jgi:hypothetical protein
MKDIWIFDLDGTLADIRHRRHFVEGKNKDWPSFHASCADDTPNVHVIDVFKKLSMHNPCWILSGRDDSVKEQTLEWLFNNGICFEKIFMRSHGDHQPDVSLKEGWLKEIIKTHSILGVFDDRDRLVKMWRSHGLTCFQVAEGDF